MENEIVSDGHAPIPSYSVLEAYTENQSKTMFLFTQKMSKYLEYVKENQFILEVEKCCGYKEIMTLYKTATLLEFHTAVGHHFMNPNIGELYVIGSFGEKLTIPKDGNVLFRDFIRAHESCFKPAYPVPSKVIYRIIFDDGHTHDNMDTMG